MKRKRETPLIREVKTYWHFGETGTGKSYSRLKLIEEYGEENVYYLTAFNSGAFDNYQGEKILWIEDYRGEFKYQEILRLLDVYKAEIPCRFSNKTALWNEVHITSSLYPKQCYSEIAKEDRIEQLMRRITEVIYHFKDDNGGFCTLSMNHGESVTCVRERALVIKKMGRLEDFEEIITRDSYNYD